MLFAWALAHVFSFLLFWLLDAVLLAAPAPAGVMLSEVTHRWPIFVCSVVVLLYSYFASNFAILKYFLIATLIVLYTND